MGTKDYNLALDKPCLKAAKEGVCLREMFKAFQTLQQEVLAFWKEQSPSFFLEVREVFFCS